MHPYAAPHTLTPALTRAHAYWDGLRRKDAPMPFWDNLKPADLGDLEPNAFTLEAFEKPERFRFGLIGEELKQAGLTGFEGLFLDEHDLPELCGYLRSQASSTIESREPTLYRPGKRANFARLLLPMWGEGRIGLLLGVVEWF